MAFLAKADLWFAFEPGSCDRNRLEELLGETDYKSVRGKLVDFNRAWLKPITTTESELSGGLMYTSDRTQPTSYKNLFLGNRTLESQFSGLLLDIPEYEKKDKCYQDVYELTHLVTVFTSILFTGTKHPPPQLTHSLTRLERH